MVMNKRGRHSCLISPKSDKRGAEMTTNMIIFIVLGVIIVVMLVIGLSFGWSTFTPWVSKTNVDTVVQGCELACTTNGQYAFCSQPRTLIDTDKNEYKQITCNSLSQIPETTKYGISTCSSIDCGAFDITKCNLVPSGKIRTVGC